MTFPILHVIVFAIPLIQASPSPLSRRISVMAQSLPASPVFHCYPSRGTKNSSFFLPRSSPSLSFSDVPLYASPSVISCSGKSILAPRAVLEEQSPDDSVCLSEVKDILVVGASGGVGQLVVASLLDRNIKVRLLVRDPEKALLLFGRQDENKVKILKGDTRNPSDMDPVLFKGVTHVICCTGTTAFPSRRWDDDNSPEKVDYEGVRNLVLSLPQNLKRLVLVSSVGVTKFNELPWSIMNLFGVLKYKKMGEGCVCSSGLPFTIIRAARLTDGPYTSYDLNTLLKATAGERRAVIIGKGDKLVGEVSRLVVAEACIQALDVDCTENQIYEINSVKGEGPGKDNEMWKELFRSAK